MSLLETYIVVFLEIFAVFSKGLEQMEAFGGCQSVNVFIEVERVTLDSQASAFEGFRQKGSLCRTSLLHKSHGMNQNGPFCKAPDCPSFDTLRA